MVYDCPHCGNRIDDDAFFQATGLCMCDQCVDIVDLGDVTVDSSEEGEDEDDMDSE